MVKEESREGKQVAVKEVKKDTPQIQPTEVYSERGEKNIEKKGYREEKEKREVVRKKDGKKLEGEKERKKKK